MNVSPAEFSAAYRSASQGKQLLDVRTLAEVNSGCCGNAIHIPVDALIARCSELNPKNPVFIYCKSGGRAVRAAHILADHGFPEDQIFVCIPGGYDDLKDDVLVS